MKFALLGSGSWATAIAKILTDNNNNLNWWFRNMVNMEFIKQKKHNKHYLSNVFFNTDKVVFRDDIIEIINSSEVIIIAIPSTHIHENLENLDKNIFKNKKIISAVKGVLPQKNQLLHEYLMDNFNIQWNQYFTLLGPCHAEEVAAELTSYLTFSGEEIQATQQIARYFTNEYIYTRVNTNIVGVQFAAVLKNIYALGAGIVDGLGYGDNFLSGYITNCANEMQTILLQLIEKHKHNKEDFNFLQTVYIGDLLVTCYSLHSRNRQFGKLIGKGFSVKTAQLELNMIAEGYNASKCIYIMNQEIDASMPIINSIYHILWHNESAIIEFKKLEILFN